MYMFLLYYSLGNSISESLSTSANFSVCLVFFSFLEKLGHEILHNWLFGIAGVVLDLERRTKDWKFHEHK